jgi:hypothetical protein
MRYPRQRDQKRQKQTKDRRGKCTEPDKERRKEVGADPECIPPSPEPPMHNKCKRAESLGQIADRQMLGTEAQG